MERVPWDEPKQDGSFGQWQSHNQRTQIGAEQRSDLGCQWLNIAECVPSFVDLKSSFNLEN